MKSIWLTKLPMPPSVNFALIPQAMKKRNPKNGKEYWGGYMRPSKELIAFKNLIVLYGKRHQAGIGRVSESLKEMVALGWVLRVDCFIAFHEDRVFSVPNKKILKIDGSNRIKPLLDGVAAMLGIDDSVFFRGDCEKVTTAQKEFECTMVRIQPVRHRSLSQIQDMMKQELQSDAPTS